MLSLIALSLYTRTSFELQRLLDFYTLTQLIEAGFSPAELRYVLISAHYRQPLNFVAKDKDGTESFPALAGAGQALQKIAKFAQALKQQGQVTDPTGLDLRVNRVRSLP